VVYTNPSLAHRETKWTHPSALFATNNGMFFVSAWHKYRREIHVTNGRQQRHVVGYDEKTLRKSATWNTKGWRPSRSGYPQFEPPHEDWLPNTDFCCCLYSSSSEIVSTDYVIFFPVLRLGYVHGHYTTWNNLRNKSWEDIKCSWYRDTDHGTITA
jgi:hypothetical protein